MYSCFVDSSSLFNEVQEYYRMVIPTRLSSDSYRRNKTLFIIMRKYDLTLNEYIQLNKPNNYQRLLFFAQLLETLLYLNKHSIVHRDLKSDNLLICNTTNLIYGQVELYVMNFCLNQIHFFYGTLQQENYDNENLLSISLITSSIIERLVHSMYRKNSEKSILGY
ncbi:unnamed protein product [Rotaria sordida]|uniref:non-specific serine/threonine protein kinase n=1 Tax=Rotaria sordida TaxID=392033 RepID=A0A815UIQ7_9BILA|nr:unnamed protein product [Rotaria sordida]CAF1660365.1 unnamed protein product [Rotaria sordida]